MPPSPIIVTAIGGPTALLEIAGLRLLTDPTFDAPGRYPLGAITLTKQTGPAIAVDAIGRIDGVLLSHDHHLDNLDHAGRALLPQARRVWTTRSGAGRLGGHAEGMAPWETAEITTPDHGVLRVTATPARHGPVGIEPITGEVIGFVLQTEAEDGAIYVSGDTVWYEGVAAIAHRFDVRLAILFTGSAQPRGPFHVTMDSNDAIEAAHAFPAATIMAVHHDGWAHFTQSQADLAQAFGVVGLAHRLRVLEPGVPETVVWGRGGVTGSVGA